MFDISEFHLEGGGHLPPLARVLPPLEIRLAIFFQLDVMNTELKLNTRNIQHKITIG